MDRFFAVLRVSCEHGVNLRVDTRCEAVHHASFLAADARLHRLNVIFRTLAPFGIVAFELHLFGLQVVARIELIRDTYGTDIERLYVLKEVLLTERQHMQHTRLCQVVTVFRTAFALCQPDGLALFAQMTDIRAQLLGVR